MWESIINAPDEKSGVSGSRFGRAMTLPDAINNLGEATGSRSGIKPPHGAYVSKGEGDCVLAAVISRLCGTEEVGNPDSINVEMVPWGSKMLASIAPYMKIALGKRCRCSTHLGCPAQRVHVELPLFSAGTVPFPPGMCGKESDIGLFSIITGENGATIRNIRGGMHFMNPPSRTFHAAVEDAKYSKLYIKPYSIAAMRSDLPHAGDEYLLSLLRLSVEAEKWASDVMSSISKLMSNKCGCGVSRSAAD